MLVLWGLADGSELLCIEASYRKIYRKLAKHSSKNKDFLIELAVRSEGGGPMALGMIRRPCVLAGWKRRSAEDG